MATINQLVSEIAHSVKQPDSLPVRRAIKLGIIHARNDIIRHNYENHGYVDKGVQQKFRVELINVPDGDLANSTNLDLTTIKRSKNKIPRPVRLTNNLPFTSVRTISSLNPKSIPFIKESVSQYYKHLPGFCQRLSYDYINDYLYINSLDDNYNVGNFVIIEAAFEQPQLIKTETSDGGIIDINSITDDDEFLLPEDMIDDIKKLILDTWNVNVIRNTNEVYVPSKVS